MTFIQALYGSQYKELMENGRDVAKGRMNGNIFLAAFIFVVLIVAFLLVALVLPRGTFDMHSSGGMSGKSMGKLIALPVFGAIYFIISKTIGTQENYNRITGEFSQFPAEVQAKANKKLLVPFFVLLGVMVVLMVWQVRP